MRAWAYASLSLGVAAALLGGPGCGDRTGLLIPIVEVVEEGGVVNGEAPEGGPDAIADALPPLDVAPPPPDAPNDCPDAGSTLIYVITSNRQLLSFYPPTLTFRLIGTLNCETRVTDAQPFSMAVDRTGVAYVLYGNSSDPNNGDFDGEIFRVSTATASCVGTGFVPGQQGFDYPFGMGYSQNASGAGESLWVIGGNTGTLATIDTKTMILTPGARTSPSLATAELTGTGGGGLFAFYGSMGAAPCTFNNHNKCTDSAIGQIDKATGAQTNQAVISGLAQNQAWAFAFWGGDFYMFTEPNPNDATGGTLVTRYDPGAQTATVATRRPDIEVVGAGVSTCAPAR